MGAATADQIGNWLVAAAGLMGLVFLALGIANHVRTLRRKARRPLVLRFATKRELREMRNGVEKEIKDLSEYTHLSVHDLRTALGAVQLKLEAMRLEARKDFESLLLPIEAKLERVFVLVTKLEAHGKPNAGGGKS